MWTDVNYSHRKGKVMLNNNHKQESAYSGPVSLWEINLSLGTCWLVGKAQRSLLLGEQECGQAGSELKPKQVGLLWVRGFKWCLVWLRGKVLWRTLQTSSQPGPPTPPSPVGEMNYAVHAVCLGPLCYRTLVCLLTDCTGTSPWTQQTRSKSRCQAHSLVGETNIKPGNSHNYKAW